MKIINYLVILSCFLGNIALGKNVPGPTSFMDVVYHGSNNGNIKVFEPRAENIRNLKEGELVFATPSIKLASCYLFKWDDSWVHQFVSSLEGAQTGYEVYMVIGDHDRFTRANTGGAIYLLPSKSFVFEENKGLGIYEWTSKERIVAFTKIHFSSPLEAMKTFGVKVYFLSKQQFQSYLILSGEEQVKFLNHLGQEPL